MKMRIQHLIEMKSNRERRNLTLEDVSEATGISRSALYKMNSNPNYNPSKEVMEKLAEYFDCSLDDLFDRTIKHTFALETAFPKDTKLSAMVLCLLAASNDLTFLRKLLIRYDNEDNAGIIKDLRSSESNFVFFLCLGFLYEGMRVLRRLLQEKTAIKLFEKMNEDGKIALKALKESSDANDSLYKIPLQSLRNEFFHYKEQQFGQALKTIKEKQGSFIAGPTHAESRYLIADDIRGEIFRAFIDFDSGGKHDEVKMKGLIATMGHFTVFTSVFLVEYCKFRNVF